MRHPNSLAVAVYFQPQYDSFLTIQELKMAIFAVVATQGQETLGTAVEREFPTSFLRVTASHWLVSSSGTSEEVAARVGLKKPVAVEASGIVYKISGYYGWASPNIWEWLAAHATTDG